MSQKDDNQIRYRLKVLSQIDPSPESAERAVQRIRESLTHPQTKTGTKIVQLIMHGRALKFAAAAVFFICAGFIAGRILSPNQDIDTLQASLEPVIRQKILAQINEQWQKEYARNYTQIKEDLGRQMSQEMTELTEQTIAASSTITDQRLKELIELIEAARAKDRQWIAAALEKIELDRRQDNARIGGLVTFAAQTNRLQQIEQN